MFSISFFHFHFLPDLFFLEQYLSWQYLGTGKCISRSNVSSRFALLVWLFALASYLFLGFFFDLPLWKFKHRSIDAIQTNPIQFFGIDWLVPTDISIEFNCHLWHWQVTYPTDIYERKYRFWPTETCLYASD